MTQNLNCFLCTSRWRTSCRWGLCFPIEIHCQINHSGESHASRNSSFISLSSSTGSASCLLLGERSGKCCLSQSTMRYVCRCLWRAIPPMRRRNARNPHVLFEMCAQADLEDIKKRLKEAEANDEMLKRCAESTRSVW